MTRWRVIAMAVVISGCGHGESPPPGCGNRIIEFGESCDDGNDIADDGCDQCVAMNCGNGRLDEFEECDDGNVLPGDGCSADCQRENFSKGTLDTGWLFQDLDATVTGCPVGFELIEITAVGQQTGTQTQLFDCLLGSARLVLPLDLYIVTATSKSFDLDVFATSLPQTIDLRGGFGAFNTTLFNDGGFFEVAWQLVGDLSNNVLNCMQANVKTVEIVTSPNGTTDSRDCLAGSGFTTAIAEGAYNVSLTASDAQSTVIATSTSLPDQLITAPNGRTNVGTIPIRIPGM